MNKPARGLAYFDRRSIRYPLARLIIAAVLLSIALSLLNNAFILLGNVRNDIHRNLTSAANAVASAAGAAVVFQDAKVAQGMLRMFEAYPEVEAAALYTQSGVRLASHGHPLPEKIWAIAPTSPEIPLLAKHLELHLPIVVDGSNAGAIHLRARLDDYWRIYLSSIANTVLVAISAGLLALILAMRFLNHIIRPVRMLAESANDARLHQNFAPREIPAADNEIGDLVRNFNALLTELEAGRKSLQRQHDEMEQLVADRTAELLGAKESADAANATKSRFLAAASHDLRQPIHAMRLFLDSLGGTSLDDEQRRIANYLSLSTRSLAEILNTLLDVSRLEGGIVQPRPELVSAYSLLSNIESEFAPLALAKGLRFKFFFPQHELILFTDAKMLYSLLRNLIDNAIKYTQTGGVLVGFRRRNDNALIQVWDTGIGIAPDHLESIFDEYFQVANPQRDRTLGLGLGLAIARRVANILGGGIHCASRLGKGSVFEICLPLADASDPAGPAAKRQTAHPACAAGGLCGSRVAIIEDDAMAARALELSLSTLGLKVTAYADAEQALADANIDQADFYLVDYRLPGMNGIQFLNQMQLRCQRPLRALLLTGETQSEVIDEMAMQPWKILFKPVETATLLDEMQALLAAPASA